MEVEYKNGAHHGGWQTEMSPRENIVDRGCSGYSKMAQQYISVHLMYTWRNYTQV
jgi:hypothetical protein